VRYSRRRLIILVVGCLIYRKNKNRFRNGQADFVATDSMETKSQWSRMRGECLLEGGQSIRKEENLRRERFTSPQASGDGPNAWIDRGYRQADLPRSTCAVNSASSGAVDVAA
jgi:hypothetical protein